MKSLALDVINASAPYEVYWHEVSHTYRFSIDSVVVLAIGFDDDDIIETAESYVFSIINVNNVPSPRDLKMRDTVMLIIENFFNRNQSALLYICESDDGKDMDGIENFAALIIRKDNPKFVDIVSEFSNTVAMFRVKPENPNL